MSSIDCNAINQSKLKEIERLWGINNGTGVDESLHSTEVQALLTELGLYNSHPYDETPTPEQCKTLIRKLKEMLDQF